jgi:hypothetical protein
MESSISFDINTTNAESQLGVEVWLNNQLLIDLSHVIKSIPVTVQVNNDDGEHELQIVLKNKTVNDTVVDLEGNIVQDSCLTVDNFKFDDIEVDQLVSEKAVYRHSFNTDQPVTDNRFYWNMGCNGTVSLKFSTPIYIWLLEHM